MKLRTMSVCAALVTLTGAAWAGPVTFTFTGHVTSNTFTTGPLAGLPSPSSATFSYTFESTYAGTYQNNSGNSELYRYGVHLNDNPFSSTMIQVGGVSATSTAGSIIHLNGLTNVTDFYNAYIWGTGFQIVQISLVDTNGTAFNSSSIQSLNTTLNLNDFTLAVGNIRDNTGTVLQSLDILWTGLQIDNPVIPLPTGAAMAGVGLGVIGIRRRRGVGNS